MVFTELTVTGLRCIEHAALEIPPGVRPGCGDHDSGKTSLLEAMFLLGRGRSLPMGNSRCPIQSGQDHLRVITPRCPFRASRACASRSSGTAPLRGSVLRTAATSPGQGRCEMRTHDSH